MTRKELTKELEEIYKGRCFCGMHEQCNCCNDCHKRKGFFGSTEDFEQAKAKYTFDGNGFLGENGCRIPPEDRSFTCVTHLCPNAVRKIPQIERNLFAQLSKELKEWKP
jgi:hypothetical protein